MYDLFCESLKNLRELETDKFGDEEEKLSEWGDLL